MLARGAVTVQRGGQRCEGIGSALDSAVFPPQVL